MKMGSSCAHGEQHRRICDAVMKRNICMRSAPVRVVRIVNVIVIVCAWNLTCAICARTDGTKLDQFHGHSTV